jgi:hypothetical protein
MTSMACGFHDPILTVSIRFNCRTMKFIINHLIDLALKEEADAIRWDERIASVKVATPAVLKEKAKEVSEEKWQRVSSFWKAVGILEANDD